MNRILYINIFFLTLLFFNSCGKSIVSKLEKVNERVRLSQPNVKNTSLDTLNISEAPKHITYTDKEGNQRIITKNEVQENGEDMSLVELAEVTVTARSKNVSERSGKVNLDFVVTVPSKLINDKWQLQLTPVLYGKSSDHLDKIFLSGVDFLKQQQKGYAQYQAFMNSIIPDEEYLKQMFDQKGYKKAMADLENEFYQSWKNDVLFEKEWIDWADKINKRYLLFNRKMERNKRNVVEGSLLEKLPSHWLKRDIDGSIVPNKYKDFFSDDFRIIKKEITPEDSSKIAERFFNYEKMMENERKKAELDTKYHKYVKFPFQPARLDTVIESGSNFQYFYTQEVSASEDVKKLELTLNGRIVATDESTYRLPDSDTITYYISSMLQFLDLEPRYKLQIIERKALVNLTSYISFATGSAEMDERLGENERELSKIFETIEKLTFSGELVMDSINMVASASPEGHSKANYELSRLRAKSLKQYLVQKTDDKEAIDTLINTSWIGEDWKRLTKKISNSEDIKNKQLILDIVQSENDLDIREQKLRLYKEDYEYIKEYLYPELRTVSFEFHLHRRDMEQEVIETTIIDDYYEKGMEHLKNRRYKDALVFLSDYNDYNTAVCLMSLGYDNRAYEILKTSKDTANRNYLLAILGVRLKKEEEAVQYFMQAAEMDETKIWRGKLDPEIYKIMNLYNLYPHER